MIIKRTEFSNTCQTSSIILLLFILPSILAFQARFNMKPNVCSRCDWNGGKKVKACPVNSFNQKIEVIECGYQKPICGITVNITSDQHQVIYAGCYSRKFDKYCFKDRVKQYGLINATYCYHTCSEFFCNPYESWLKAQSPFNLFKSISIFG